MRYCWIVMGQCDNGNDPPYRETREWVVAVYTELEAAQIHCDLLRAKVKHSRRWKHGTSKRREQVAKELSETLDVQVFIDDGPTGYWLERAPMVGHPDEYQECVPIMKEQA
jgi:hypothetical protein